MNEPATDLATVHTAINELTAILTGARAALGGGAGRTVAHAAQAVALAGRGGTAGHRHGRGDVDSSPPDGNQVSRGRPRKRLKVWGRGVQDLFTPGIIGRWTS